MPQFGPVDTVSQQVTYGNVPKPIDPCNIPTAERLSTPLNEPWIVNDARSHAPTAQESTRPAGSLGNQPAAGSDAGKAFEAIVGSQPPCPLSGKNPADRGAVDGHADPHRPPLAEVTSGDEVLFAPYQPIYRPAYDLSCQFGRTNISMWIRRFITKCENEMVRVEQLFRANLMDRADYIERTDELARDLQQHRAAMFRLGEIGRY